MNTLLIIHSITLFIVLVNVAFASSEVLNNHIPVHLIQKTMSEGISYLQNTQVQETLGTSQFKGEWTSWMMNDNKVLLLGPKGKKAQDSNCFTTASIHNALAKTYLKYPEFKQIPSMLDKAIENIDLYKNQDRFAFWQLLPRNAHLHKEGEPLPLVRRPNNYELYRRFINNASNVPEDADDTAVAYMAYKLHDLISTKNGLSREVKSPEKIGHLFSEYRDRKRRSVHYYNLINGANLFTGAFMTWHQKEKFFTPISWLPIGHKKPYIPYGANEVDCVVNSNVLSALTMFGELNTTDGVEKACKFINKSAKKNIAMCGVYYPNVYHFPYTAMKAYHLGASCLEEAKSVMTTFMLEHQQEDGSFVYNFKNQRWKGKILSLINKLEKGNDAEDLDIDPQDRLQNTIYATAALLYSESKDPLVDQAITKGIRYILDNSEIISEDGSRFWKGGVFFAGGTLIRSDVRWRSDAYTTALVVELLGLYRERLEEQLL